MISAIAVEKPSAAWPAAKVEIWPIERLAANPRNARIHGPEQIEQIRASLRELGRTMPVLVRENGMLIAGHGRLEAAKLEGITEVPTIVARGWAEAQCQAYAIADNKLTDSSHWDEELLRLELGSLQAAGFDLALTGFDQDELDRLLVVEGTWAPIQMKLPSHRRTDQQARRPVDLRRASRSVRQRHGSRGR